MPVRLQRKARKNRVRAAQRKAAIKRLMFMPLIKRVDVESMRNDFAEKKNVS
ncbi:hypothetical protein [Cardinium endosymbiont of Culicoides punctatus]|uniref:hypothetical protein n=1 Tax=Cardinium endosymbiont of Culicoides punctatus TaxID=2304601 RepID=UPI0010E423FD|nr:hypothetical protein [Cardinium endosymbiont of Culicoides punctatus]TDG95666.1 hypothetical protein CCPUN_01250 [Cardinium endosymbiont of Culicoides punctatus]